MPARRLRLLGGAPHEGRGAVGLGVAGGQREGVHRGERGGDQAHSCNNENVNKSLYDNNNGNVRYFGCICEENT